jgi:diguanylate cyclase (GGDEF)-like protein
VSSISFKTHIRRLILGLAFGLASSALCAQQIPEIETTQMTVSFCSDPDWLPFEAIRNSKHVGIAADYLKVIGDLSNIQFQLVETESWQQALDFVQNGQCDIISFLNQTPIREEYLDFTDDFFDAANVFVTGQDIPFLSGYESISPEKIIGVVNNYRHAEYVARYYPDLHVVGFDSESDGLLMLASGDIDIFLGSMLSVSAHIQNYGLSDLKISGLAKPHDKMRIGVRKQQTQIVERLNLAIAKIPENKHVEIFKQWNNVKVIDEIDYRLLWTALAGFVLIVILFVLRNSYVTRFNRELMAKTKMLEELQDELLQKNQSLEFLSNHDQLTSLHNRHYMIKRCESEMLRMKRFSQLSSLILFDIDHFKKINDQYGHSSGDRVLVHLAQLLKKQLREIDVVCRWGGEEFLILCPQSNIAETLTLAHRLHGAISSGAVDPVDSLTCSFGIAEYQQDESFIQWFDRADRALYSAKESGRNQIIVAD